VETLVIKSNFYRSLRQHDIPHPTTYDPTEESIQSIVKQVTFPVYVRPTQTLAFLQHFRGKGFLARTPHELHDHLLRARRKHVPMLVQQIINGPTSYGYGYKGYFGQDSQLLLLLAIQKLRQPTMFSNCTVHKSIPRSILAEYEPIIFPYLKAIGYTGLFGIEFKRDPEDGQFKLMDINARSCGDSALGPACGLDDNITAYHDALGNDVHPKNSYKSDLYYIWDPEDLYSLWLLARRGQLTCHALIPFIRPKQWNMLSRDDPRPLIHELSRLIQQYKRAR
jgi:predicted ATP-grasp superfamily ATP-dependent carboligase